MRLLDRTKHAPHHVRARTREPDEVRLLALHQMACGGAWDEDSPAFDRVSAHFVVKRSGTIAMNHTPLTRITVGSGPKWNPRCVTIEFAGNLPTRREADGSWRWWEPEEFGRDLLTPEQVQAGRDLVVYLCEQLPALRLVGAHCQVDAGEAGCCGPLVWLEVGVWAMTHAGLYLAATNGGVDPPASWWPPADPPPAVDRPYVGPLEPSPLGS